MIFGRKNKRDSEQMIREIFPNAAVFKPFTRMEKLPGVPQRIWEYFVLKHLNNVNSDGFEESFDNMMRVARGRIPESGARNATLNQLKNNGFVEIIDAILVDVSSNDLEYIPVSHHLGFANLSISELTNTPSSLTTGLKSHSTLHLSAITFLAVPPEITPICNVE